MSLCWYNNLCDRFFEFPAFFFFLSKFVASLGVEIEEYVSALEGLESFKKESWEFRELVTHIITLY